MGAIVQSIERSVDQNYIHLPAEQLAKIKRTKQRLGFMIMTYLFLLPSARLNTTIAHERILRATWRG
jgi:hypothetical protein